MNETETVSESSRSLRRTRQASLCEVVQGLTEIHVRLADHYSLAAQGAVHERVGLVMEFLAAHERSLVEYLQRFMKEAPTKVLDRRFKYVPDLFGDDLLALLAQREIRNAEELAELVQEIHGAIDAVYAPLNGSSLPEELEEFVDKLRLQEREHLITQIRAIMDE